MGVQIEVKPIPDSLYRTRDKSASSLATLICCVWSSTSAVLRKARDGPSPIGLADVCFRLVKHMREFRRALVGIEMEVDCLIQEVDALRSIYRHVDDSFRANYQAEPIFSGSSSKSPGSTDCGTDLRLLIVGRLAEDVQHTSMRTGRRRGWRYLSRCACRWAVGGWDRSQAAGDRRQARQAKTVGGQRKAWPD